MEGLSSQIKFVSFTLFFSEHAELQQPKLLLGAGAECELPGPLHEDGDRNQAAGQRHHNPASQSESGMRRTSETHIYLVNIQPTSADGSGHIFSDVLVSRSTSRWTFQDLKHPTI